MFFNWHTIDSCFLSTSWHVRSQTGFFATCLAAFLLVVFLELIRRVQRSFDQYLRDRSAFQQQKYRAQLNDAKEEDGDNEHNEEAVASSPLVGSKMQINLTRGTLKLDIMMLYHCLRSLLFMLQFGVSYCIMLMSMYFNGKLLAICFLWYANTSTRFCDSLLIAWGIRRSSNFSTGCLAVEFVSALLFSFSEPQANSWK